MTELELLQHIALLLTILVSIQFIKIGIFGICKLIELIKKH